MEIDVVAVDLNGCNAMSCGELLGLFLGRNTCNGAAIGYNGLDLVEASLWIIGMAEHGFEESDVFCFGSGQNEY